jgi:hypothetical protein
MPSLRTCNNRRKARAAAQKRAWDSFAKILTDFSERLKNYEPIYVAYQRGVLHQYDDPKTLPPGKGIVIMHPGSLDTLVRSVRGLA